jgi:hypothetical protein
LTFDINGVEVRVEPGQEVFVVTSPFGDCVSTFTDSRKFEQSLDKGRWDESYVYKLSFAGGLELLQQPATAITYVY